MSKIIQDFEKLGITPGTKVSGLFAQTLVSVYQHMFDAAETIESIVQHDEDPDMAIVKTIEMSARTHIYTSDAEVDLPPENRQYVVNGTNLLTLIDKAVDVNKLSATSDDKEALQLSSSDNGIDTPFSTLPKELISSLTPFLNYIATNKEALNDTLDVNSLTFRADGVTYDIDTLASLTQTFD